MCEKELISVDKYGTKTYRVTVPCDRCGGDGVYKWGAMISYHGLPPVPQYAGTCFKCGGSGVMEVEQKEYTPERRAQLDRQNEKRAAKSEEKRAAARAERDRINAAYKAEQERKEQERRERAALSDYVGTVGDKVETWVTLTRTGHYPCRDIFKRETEGTYYIFTDDDNNVLTWFTQSGELNAAGRIEPGDRFLITGTVKKHEVYNDQKQTILTRVKVRDQNKIRL